MCSQRKLRSQSPKHTRSQLPPGRGRPRQSPTSQARPRSWSQPTGRWRFWRSECGRSVAGGENNRSTCRGLLVPSIYPAAALPSPSTALSATEVTLRRYPCPSRSGAALSSALTISRVGDRAELIAENLLSDSKQQTSEVPPDRPPLLACPRRAPVQVGRVSCDRRVSATGVRGAADTRKRSYGQEVRRLALESIA